MKKLFIAIIVVILVALLIWGSRRMLDVFTTYTRHITLPSQLLATSTVATSTSSSTADWVNDLASSSEAFGQKSSLSLDPASTNVDSSSWITYESTNLSFSLKYPQDMIVNEDVPDTLTLFVPKAHYFHWPLLDEVKITITASSSCPTVIGGGPMTIATTTVHANGYTFTRTEGADVAAGNIYRELAYDTISQGTCYHLDLFDHGANGAGLYVSDQSLITTYDSQHQADLDKMVAAFMGIVNSFHIVSM